MGSGGTPPASPITAQELESNSSNITAYPACPRRARSWRGTTARSTRASTAGRRPHPGTRNWGPAAPCPPSPRSRCTRHAPRSTACAGKRGVHCPMPKASGIEVAVDAVNIKDVCEEAPICRAAVTMQITRVCHGETHEDSGPRLHVAESACIAHGSSTGDCKQRYIMVRRPP